MLKQSPCFGCDKMMLEKDECVEVCSPLHAYQTYLAKSFTCSDATQDNTLTFFFDCPDTVKLGNETHVEDDYCSMIARNVTSKAQVEIEELTRDLVTEERVRTMYAKVNRFPTY